MNGGQSGGGCPQPPYPVYEQAADAAGLQTVAPPAPPPSIRPGTTLTRVSVQVDFALRDK